MSRKKLTLSVEERLTRRAKAVAKKRGTSVSRLVETFFTALKQEEGPFDAEQIQQRGEEKSAEDSGGSSPTDYGPSEYEPSEWARRWHGAFAKEGEAYPDEPAWEEKVIAEEIEKKHAA